MSIYVILVGVILVSVILVSVILVSVCLRIVESNTYCVLLCFVFRRLVYQLCCQFLWIVNF
jgi:hypothetical protein